MTTGEVEAHLAEVYPTNIRRETISKITDRVLGELADWQNRPLDRVYPLVVSGAIVVEIRNGRVYAAIGVTVDGQPAILGLWIDTGGEGAKYWLDALTEIKNRAVDDVFIVVCDGLKGLPESIEATWPLAIVQTCVLHLICNTFRLGIREDWDKMACDLRPVYTAVIEADAAERLDEFHTIWGNLTNRFRRATRARGHFPNEQAAMKCLYMVARLLDPERHRPRAMDHSKPALNAFAFTF